MLKDELRLYHYSKTQHRNALIELLDNRSPGSIERKHQNISAVLIELGHPWISGYKPLGNYQALLREVVEDRLALDGEMAVIAEESIKASASVPATRTILSRLEDPPQLLPFQYEPCKERLKIAGKIRTRTNYLEMEARNASLGSAGESFVVDFERARLQALGKEALADRIEQISVTEGDGAGFDIRSFEYNGSDRLIEVKTTAYGKQTPFFVSRNEVAVSEVHRGRYHLYRLFRFRADPRLYTVAGSIREVCTLDPLAYAARPKSN
jgi:hypothetical protein